MTTPDFRERLYVSQYARDILALVVHRGGVPADADAAVTATFVREEEAPVVVFLDRPATRVEEGHYEVVLASAETSVPGYYTVTWNYEIDGQSETYGGLIEVGIANAAYDNLDADMKALVDDVWVKFADLFDSPYGGPNLQTYFQSHWSRGRLAQLLRTAVGLLNTTAQPHQTYNLDSPGKFPVVQWGPLLGQALYVEALKHLVRSYVEQPLVQIAGSVSRVDRRDYMDRWRSVLDDEKNTLKSQLEIFKISNMGLGRPKVLVSGGVYGRYGPTRYAGSVAARPRFWARFY